MKFIFLFILLSTSVLADSVLENISCKISNGATIQGGTEFSAGGLEVKATMGFVSKNFRAVIIPTRSAEFTMVNLLDSKNEVAYIIYLAIDHNNKKEQVVEGQIRRKPSTLNPYYYGLVGNVRCAVILAE